MTGIDGEPRNTLPWRKSSFSEPGDCVEVAIVAVGIAVRDSKDPNGPMLRFRREEWVAFLGGVRAGEFDLS